MDLHACEINDILVQASDEVRSKSVKQHRKARLNVWMPEIRLAVCTKKKAFWEWKQSSKPDQSDHLSVVNKKNTTEHPRNLCKVESDKT